MATNLDYNVNVNATNGIQALNNLQTRVGGLSAAFGGLKTAIAGIAFGSVITNAVRFADAIKDLSDSTGISIANIVGFGKALQDFGGNSQVAEKGILRLVNNIGAAAEGSASMQSAFARVGVSLEDLATLSEQEILGKVIAGLGNAGTASDKAFLKSQLLGKEFRNVTIEGNKLAESYAEQTRQSQAQAASIVAASDAFDRFEKTVNAFRDAILVAISPLTEFIAKLEPAKIQEFANNIVALITVASGLFVFSKIITLFTALGATLAALKLGTIGVTLAFSKFFLLGAAVATVFYGLASALKLFTDIDIITPIKNGVGKAYTAIKEFFGFVPNDNLSESLDKQSEAAKNTANSTAEAGGVIRDVTPAFEQLRKSLSGIAEEYARVNQLNIEQIQNQTQLIGKSREESEVSKARVELLKRESDEIRKLEDQRSRLTEDQQRAGFGKIIDEQIAKIREQTRADIESTEAAVRGSQERIRSFDLEKFARQSNLDVERDIRRIQDDIAKSTMSEMERKQYDILAAARERAETEIAAEQARRGGLLTDQEKLKFYEAAKQGTDELIAKERQLYAESRTFATGWKKAFQEYTDNATNAAQSAQRIFQKATQGMEDAFVKFARTGKLSFKDLIDSMLEELLRSQIRQVMSQVLSISGGTGQASGGSLFGGIGSFLGFANGGVIPTNEPVIVGERGPELLMGAAGRNVIPNEKLGSSNYITYNINATDARSFKDMIAQDPSFIHAVAMQGAKSTPGRR